MDWLRSLVQRALVHVDGRYQRANHLQPVGPILYAGRATYRGPSIRFDDRVRAEVGHLADVGRLHLAAEVRGFLKSFMVKPGDAPPAGDGTK